MQGVENQVWPFICYFTKDEQLLLYEPQKFKENKFHKGDQLYGKWTLYSVYTNVMHKVKKMNGHLITVKIRKFRG